MTFILFLIYTDQQTAEKNCYYQENRDTRQDYDIKSRSVTREGNIF